MSVRKEVAVGEDADFGSLGRHGRDVGATTIGGGGTSISLRVGMSLMLLIIVVGTVASTFATHEALQAGVDQSCL
jgi:hypothetical protein